MALIFGIDLGTTNSLIAVMEESRPRVIAGLGGRPFQHLRREVERVGAVV